MGERKQYREELCSLRCDLHTHSVFSDGTYTPSEIIAEAKRLDKGGLLDEQIQMIKQNQKRMQGQPGFYQQQQMKGIRRR